MAALKIGIRNAWLISVRNWITQRFAFVLNGKPVRVSVVLEAVV